MRPTQIVFNEKYLFSDTPYESDDFGKSEARRLRYSLYWKMYQRGSYRKDVSIWAQARLTNQSLYRAIRSIYGPAYRLGEFGKMYLWGGQLDPAAGDGAEVPSALPIITDNENIRPFISRVWTWSNWKTQKDIVSLQGTILGDVFIRVVDAAKAGKIYFEVVHPSVVEEITEDVWGNIKGYTITFPAKHPDSGLDVVFKEVCERSGDKVLYSTYADRELYAWNGVAAEWSEEYGFIPMIHIQHNDIGVGWGLSELHAARTKIQEMDDVASVVTDRIRRMMKSGWMFSGYNPPADSRTTATIVVPSRFASMSVEERRDTPDPIREDEPMLLASDPNARPWPLVAPSDIEGAVGHITAIMEELERDYPELKFEITRAGGDASGTALRIARKPAETKVVQRRANYDDPFVRVQQMALSIGGYRGIFPGINLDTFGAGGLDHTIGARPVFQTDEVEENEISRTFWEAAKAAKSAGLNLLIYLRRAGWSEEDLAEVRSDLEAEDARNDFETQQRQEVVDDDQGS